MKPRRLIFPPMWLLLGIALVFAADKLLPGPDFGGLASQLAGGAVLLLGLVLLVVAGGLFTRAGTGLIPFSEATMLVTHGLYAYTRNPMYLAMALILLGVAVTVGSPAGLLVTPAFMVIIQWRFIVPEEHMLGEVFPEDYPEYCQRVRRWL